jgi:hypothetical protein
MNDEAKAEAGRLQQICIKEIAANEPSYLKGVYNSIGVKVEVTCTQWKLANDDQQSRPALQSIAANSPWRVTFPSLN